MIYDSLFTPLPVAGAVSHFGTDVKRVAKSGMRVAYEKTDGGMNMATETLGARILALTHRMLRELEAQFRNEEAIEIFASCCVNRFGDASRAEQAIQDLFQQATSLPARLDGLHKISSILLNVAMIERQRTDGGE